MAIFGNNRIDFNEVQATGELLPAGMYQAIIVESGGNPEDDRTGEDGLVSCKNGKGRYLPMTFEIIEGEHKGRKIYKNFNLENPNEMAVRIAQSELKELLQAICWDFSAKPYGPDDTTEMHMIPMTLQITIRKDKNSDEERNEIKHFKPKQSFGTAPAPTTTGKPATPAAPAVPPWQRKADPPKTETPKAEAPKAETPKAPAEGEKK
jgi:hypothetical protein